ncbi:beta-lactamase/transpeptidase-like protein [Xylariales sp. AK1849]|nr:beta-lactamase/transpeptidase-like protein [Xylariales sp. AK1849]
MRLTHSRCLAALLFTPAATASASQKVLFEGRHNPLDSDFEEFAVETLLEWHVPGVAIAVVDGEEMWAAGYGNATLPSTPVTPSTLFYGGSTTKAFTAALLSLLIDSGTYSSLSRKWRTPISSLIREDFVLSPSYLWTQDHLTLEDLLTHRSGFPRHDKSLGLAYGPDGHRSGVRDFTRSLRHLPMTAEPRVEFRYCNLMYMVASHAIQTLTGQWLGSLLRTMIWEPLGMKSTYFSLPDALAAPEHLAHGYFWDFGFPSSHGQFHSVPFAGLDEASGAGGVVSNVLDYAKWIRCLIDEAEPLSKEGHEAIKTPRVIPSGSGKGFDGPMGYAFGWHTGTYRGHRVLTHSGGMEAYGTEVWFFPGLKYGVVAMGNTALTSNWAARILVWKLVCDRLRVPEGERYDWPAAFTQSLEDIGEMYDNGVERLYPNRPDPPLPPARRIRDYTGTYYHPAYHNVTIELGLARNDLRAIREDFVWQMTFDFQHVSGEFWIIWIDMKNSPNLLNGQLARAEFRTGVSGKVDELLIEFMEDGSEGIITFERVA